MLKPWGKRVLVRMVEKKQEYNLLILPDKDSPVKEAVVVSSNVADILAGSTVLVHINGCTKVDEGYLVTEDCVLGVLE